jgi:hypothetical protein
MSEILQLRRYFYTTTTSKNLEIQEKKLRQISCLTKNKDLILLMKSSQKN